MRGGFMSGREVSELRFVCFGKEVTVKFVVLVSRANNVICSGICCPGGLFTALQYEPWQLKRARSAGHHCGRLTLMLQRYQDPTS